MDRVQFCQTSYFFRWTQTFEFGTEWGREVSEIFLYNGCPRALGRQPGLTLTWSYFIWCWWFLPKYWSLHRRCGVFLGWYSAGEFSRDRQALWSMPLCPHPPIPSGPVVHEPTSFFRKGVPSFLCLCSFHGAMSTAKFLFSCFWGPRELRKDILPASYAPKGYSYSLCFLSKIARV